jgi:hypothetical protein
MHTNHRRSVSKARQDSSHNRYILIAELKRETVRGRRTNEREVLSAVVRGAVDAQDALFALDTDVSNPWNWD